MRERYHADTTQQTETPVRLNKYLAQSGICSRREADRLIEEGKVLVDGQTAQAGLKVLSGQKITVDGRLVKREEQRILLAFYKPRGVACTTDNRWGDTTVADILQYPKRVFYVGRLDKDSEGLLLMTNDGDLQNAIMKASNYHEKEYQVEVDAPIGDTFIKKMASGVFLKELDVTTRPCRIRRTGKAKFTIILTQGLNRQIRRMCEACGRKVIHLKRVRVMNITLDGLTPGQYRMVTPEEVRQLESMLKKNGSLQKWR